MIKKTDTSKRKLFLLGAVATLIAGLVFRRNLGAEITLFTTQPSPSTAADWFTLLQNNTLLGMGMLNVFDTINYVLLGIMFAALYFALRKTDRGLVSTATFLSLAGIIVYLATNTAFSMISLSNQYASATTGIQKSSLLTTGQAILANGDPGAVYEGTGGYISLFLIAIAGLLFSMVMFRSTIFQKATAYIGATASILDLIYIIGLVFVPPAQVNLLSALCLATAGLLLLVWHLLIGLKLYQLSRATQLKGGVNQ